MSELLQDLRFGLRSLRKSPGFTTVAILTIGIGIGANAAIFSFVDNVLLKPLPYPEPERIVHLYERRPDQGWNSVSTLNYLDWAKENKAFEEISVIAWWPVTLTGMETPRELNTAKVSAHYFDIYRVKAALGRTFVDGEDAAGKDHVAVITDKTWKGVFGSDPNIIGRTVTLDGEPNTIIGVLKGGTAFDRGYYQMWRPMGFIPTEMTRDFHWLAADARLAPGVSLAEARSRMNAKAISIARDYPASNKGWGIVLQPLPESAVAGDTVTSLRVLMAAVGMVLLIGCANLANLTLARGISREREVAIRSSLGAGRWRLVRQFMTESLLLSILGGLLGLAVAYGGLAALKASIPPWWIPPEANVEVDARVLAFTLGLSVVSGVVFGLIPALKASSTDLTLSIKEGSLGMSSGTSRRYMRGALVVTEVALACILLSGAGLLIHSFFKMQQVDLGFDSTNVITASMPMAGKQYSTAAQMNGYLDRLRDRIAALPGVRDVAFTSALPLSGWGYGMPFQVVGTKMTDMANRPSCFMKMVSASYFHAIGMRLTRGRLLSEQDLGGTPPVAVITESLAKKYFPGADPIGKQISVQEITYNTPHLGREIPWEIVGVVADEKINGVTSKDEDSPGFYVTNEQSPQNFHALVVRGSLSAASLEHSITEAIHEVNKDQVVQDVKLLEQIKSDSMGDNRLRSSLLAIFAGVALLLSAIGLYGVISYSVVQRTREIGIRTALGATSTNILSLILKNGMALTGLGLVIGIAGTLVLGQFLSTLLFNVDKYDPVTLCAVTGILFVMGLLACYLPARRATRVNPIIALRYE